MERSQVCLSCLLTTGNIQKVSTEKSVAYIGIASGRWAGLRAVEHLHGVFGYRQVNQYPKSVYIPAVHEVVDKEGNVLSEEIKTRIETQIKGFLAFSKALA